MSLLTVFVLLGLSSFIIPPSVNLRHINLKMRGTTEWEKFHIFFVSSGYFSLPMARIKGIVSPCFSAIFPFPTELFDCEMALPVCQKNELMYTQLILSLCKPIKAVLKYFVLKQAKIHSFFILWHITKHLRKFWYFLVNIV